MVRLKIKAENDKLILINKTLRDEKINISELNLMESKHLIGFADMNVIGAKRFRYEIPNCMSVDRILKNGVDKALFYSIVLKSVDVVYAIQNYGLNINNLCTDTTQIYFDNNSGEIYFLYRPVMNGKNFVNINKLFYDLSVTSKPLFGDDFRESYNLFLRQCGSFDVAQWLNFIESNCPGRIEQCERLNINAPFYDNCSNAQSVHLDDTVMLVNNVNSGDGFPNNIASDSLNSDGMRACDNGIDLNYVSPSMDDTVALDAFGVDTALNEGGITEPLYSCEDTVVLNETSLSRKRAMLVTVRDGRSVEISKSEFIIGKDEAVCDLVIHNPSVSRKHLIITFDGKDYYATDNGSTNKTAVNGVTLVSHTAQKLENYDRLLLADEIVDFQIAEDNN